MKYDLIISNELKNKITYQNNLKKNETIDFDIKDVRYKISNSKKELNYNKNLELNFKTKIKIKEVYVVKNYKQIQKYYWNVINDKYYEIIDLKNELKNMDDQKNNLINHNLNDSLNTRINIIDNFINKLYE